MAGDNVCNVCNRKVLRHSYHRRCTLCKYLVHIKCLPQVNKNDTIYTLRNEDSWYCTQCTAFIFPFNHNFSDNDFISCLSDYWENSHIVPYELLNSGKIFQPFELNANFNDPLSDVDPDLQFYNSNCNNVMSGCDYYLEDSFNKKIKELNNDLKSLDF